MKESYLLELAARRLTPLLLLCSIWALYRGHNAPGGGFIGGLLAASALGFYSMSFGPAATRNYMKVHPHKLMGFGLILALAAGIPGFLYGKAFLSGLWTELPLLGSSIKLGTPLLFDLGVYFTVIGVTVSMLLDLEED